MNSIVISALSVGSILLLLFIYIRKKQARPSFSPFTENFLREPGETLRERREKPCCFWMVFTPVVSMGARCGF